MATQSLSLRPISIAFSRSDAQKTGRSNPTRLGLPSSFLGDVAFLRSTNPIPCIHRPLVTTRSRTVFSSLPTAKTDKASAEKIYKWSARAIKAFGMAELEARKLKYSSTGTEALLMGILVEGTSLAAKFLRANGITLFKVREETVKRIGKSDLYYFSPEHPPLTEAAQRALDWAIDEKMKSGEDGEVTVTHLLLGIWVEKDSPGYEIMASLGFDDEKVQELAKSMDKDASLTYR
ncbi:hypothetical protein AAC387_Pa08g0437 [Persea americana]